MKQIKPYTAEWMSLMRIRHSAECRLEFYPRWENLASVVFALKLSWHKFKLLTQ